MSNTHAISLKRSTALLAALTFMAMLTVVNFASFFGTASAAQLQSRSLTLSSTMPGTSSGDGVAGSATNGSAAAWTFSFTTAGILTSVDLLVCDDPISTVCTPPDVTLDVSSATSAHGTLGTPVGQNGITFTPTTPFAASTPSTFTLDGIVNPGVTDAFFVRMTTDLGDDGVVASAITEGIEITARVKETLGFSTGGAQAGQIDNPSTNCAPITTDGAIRLGDPVENALDMNTAYYNYSAFRLYTNAANGAVVTYEGELPTRGGGVYNPTNDMINSIGATSTASAAGTEQFGLAVDSTVAANATAAANSVTGGTVDLTYVDGATEFDVAGTPAAGQLTIGAEYRNGGANSFAFTDSQAGANGSDVIASSTSYVDCVTVPVKYVGNISALTPAGTYTTTIVYTAVPTY